MTDSSFVTAGTMTATAQDAALVYAVLAPTEHGHFFTTLYDGGVRGPPQPQLTHFMEHHDLKGIRVGFFSEWFFDAVPAIRQRCFEVVSFLQHRGASIVKVSIPHLQLMLLSHIVKETNEFGKTAEDDYFFSSHAYDSKTRSGMGRGLSANTVLAMHKLRAWSVKYMEDLYEKEGINVIVNPTLGKSL